MNMPPAPPLLISLLMLFVSVYPWQATADPIGITAMPVPLDTKQPEVRHIGDLRYLGGLHLISRHPAFGGLSALGSTADGSLLISVTDRGYRVELIPNYDSKGHLTGIAGADLSPLTGADGEVLTSKFASDAESLSPGANGEIIVSFERQHRLLIYPPGELTPMPMPPPEGLSDAPLNGGIEALTLLADGRLLAITEKLGAKDQQVGWVSDRAGWSPLIYAASDGFKPTGAATLPGGDVLVLERAYGLRDGSRARIRRIPEHTIEPGALLEGALVAELKPPLSVDNMEGIAVRPQNPAAPLGGKVIVYLVSDDNFNPDEQRTLLMMFELEE